MGGGGLFWEHKAKSKIKVAEASNGVGRVDRLDLSGKEDLEQVDDPPAKNLLTFQSFVFERQLVAGVNLNCPAHRSPWVIK